MHWHYVCSLAELQSQKRLLFRKERTQIVLFWVNNTVYAMDNRCPHEGYPLMQGELNSESCTLTCHWHNWKFGLKSGQALVGQDAVRIYTTEIRNQDLWIDLSPLPPDELKAQRLKALKEAFEKRQYGRIARELTRMHYQELQPEDALIAALKWANTRLEFGSTHAHAVAADWLSLSREAQTLPTQLAPLSEAIDHLALDVLGKGEFPYPTGQRTYTAQDFLKAVEAENEGEAVQLIRGAWASGLHFNELLPEFIRAALAHYNDFGHSLIYVQKTQELLSQLDGQVEEALSLSLLRSLIYATREDLLPEFSTYQDALSAFQGFGSLNVPPQLPPLSSAQQAMAWLSEVHSQYQPEALYQSLLHANALNLLYFDESLQYRIEVKAGDTAGWLDATHAITFANAVHQLCPQLPESWWAGLLQMAAFYGRNVKHRNNELNTESYQVQNENTFWSAVKLQLQDHGLSAPIFAAHWVKTALAVRSEIRSTTSTETKKLLLAGLKRFLNSPLKQKHIQRTLYQSIDLVSRDFL